MHWLKSEWMGKRWDGGYEFTWKIVWYIVGVAFGLTCLISLLLYLLGVI